MTEKYIKLSIHYNGKIIAVVIQYNYFFSIFNARSNYNINSSTTNDKTDIHSKIYP